MAIIDDIYQQFKDYFGEDKVDLQVYDPDDSRRIKIERYTPARGDFLILVYWPTVTVTNEYDNSIDIWDLYSLTIVNSGGKLCTTPSFIRSTYDRIQWNSDYMHSHIRSIGKSQLSYFKSSCLGSGPINRTIARLKGTSYPGLTSTSDYLDMNIWKLYCWELDKYVTVESIAGVPYKKLSQLGSYSQESSGQSDFIVTPYKYIPPKFKDLIAELIRNLITTKVLKFSFIDGNFDIATNYIETVLKISNCFINLYNSSSHIQNTLNISPEELKEEGIIEKMYIKGNIIYNKQASSYPIEVVLNSYLFTFKGKEVKMSLKDFKQTYESNEVILLNLELIDFIVYLLLKYINFKYGQNSNSSDKKDRLI